MIYFPKNYVALRYPGYFWNASENALYSLKIGGVLKPLKVQAAWWGYGNVIPKGYNISVNGRRFRIGLDEIDRFLIKSNYTIPETH